MNSIPGLAIANSVAGVRFTILLVTVFMSDIPVELRESAYPDGAGEWRTLISFIAPATRSAIVAAGLFSFVVRLGEFLRAVTPNTNGSITPSITEHRQDRGRLIDGWGGLMATSTIALIPAMILLIAAQPYISVGLTAGAVNG